jgi:agmatinase
MPDLPLISVADQAIPGARNGKPRFTIDVCDPGHAPGTGTPEPGGLSARQLLDAVSRIGHELPVVGMDIVEVSPPFDHAEITAMLGNRVVLEALSGMARRRADGDGPRWNRAKPLLEDRGSGVSDSGSGASDSGSGASE